ncbi:MAG: KH domain-containing protein [Firmicutes bacterium]|nr:KH domain-containing protein [Bacillota bacterium]
MLEIVRYLVNALVKDKENSSVELHENLILITVSKDDMGSVIGRNGRVAKAIRTIARGILPSGGVRYTIDILNQEEREELEKNGGLSSYKGGSKSFQEDADDSEE